ncbi:MAG TPA: hypothetical protein VEJ63_03165 [Planctomycetota bacterium]|nr:hypothetical protein [Planctomycetota bacterium]
MRVGTLAVTMLMIGRQEHADGFRIRQSGDYLISDYRRNGTWEQWQTSEPTQEDAEFLNATLDEVRSWHKPGPHKALFWGILDHWTVFAYTAHSAGLLQTFTTAWHPGAFCAEICLNRPDIPKQEWGALIERMRDLRERRIHD